MPHDEAQHLLNAIRENFSPQGVALIAAKLRPACVRGEAAREAERQCQWLADRLIELLGTDEYHAICDELGL
ncbi:MAG TPA: hypothetical protein VF184_12345 [Phycisphaeraceae bacterium]